MLIECLFLVLLLAYLGAVCLLLWRLNKELGEVTRKTYEKEERRGSGRT